MVHTMTALQRRQEESRTTPKISERRAVPALQGMPRFLGVGSARQSANVIARDGTQGHGRALAHGERIQNSFGSRHDLSSVRMHVGRSSGEACDRLGAAAFATGSSIAFRADPDLWLAAHEAAHVIQQRHGEGPPAGLDSPGDRHERAASAVADRVVAGKSARDLLPRGERRAAGSTGAVQRYTIETLGGGRAQVGESKQTALFGSQTLYATSALISGANSKLQAAGKTGLVHRAESGRRLGQRRWQLADRRPTGIPRQAGEPTLGRGKGQCAGWHGHRRNSQWPHGPVDRLRPFVGGGDRFFRRGRPQCRLFRQRRRQARQGRR
jgi:hypothetical protein